MNEYPWCATKSLPCKDCPHCSQYYQAILKAQGGSVK